jgi:hypothetical protein
MGLLMRRPSSLDWVKKECSDLWPPTGFLVLDPGEVLMLVDRLTSNPVHWKWHGATNPISHKQDSAVALLALHELMRDQHQSLTHHEECFWCILDLQQQEADGWGLALGTTKKASLNAPEASWFTGVNGAY